MWPSTYITDHKLSGWSVPNLVMKHKCQSSLQPEMVDLLLCEEPKNTYFTCTICHRDVIPSIKTSFQNACRFCCFTHNPTTFYCLEFYFQYSVFAKTPIVGTYKIYIKHLVVLYINIKELLPSTQVKLCDSINFLIQQDLFSGLFLKFIICGCNYTCSALLNAVWHQYWHVLWWCVCNGMAHYFSERLKFKESFLCHKSFSPYNNFVYDAWLLGHIVAKHIQNVCHSLPVNSCSFVCFIIPVFVISSNRKSKIIDRLLECSW